MRSRGIGLFSMIGLAGENGLFSLMKEDGLSWLILLLIIGPILLGSTLAIIY